MTTQPASTGSARFTALIRLLVVLTALVTTLLVLTATYHVDTTGSEKAGKVAAQAGVTVDALDLPPSGDVATTVISAAVGVTALGCALLGLCCLLALARLSWQSRRARMPVHVPRDIPLNRLVPDSRPAIPSLHHLSISRT